MKLIFLPTALGITQAYAQGSSSTWEAPGPNDLRGPCPMMNTLANHGFLPHDGGNITKPNAVHALTTALNFDTSLAELMWEQAIIANPEVNATYFTLDNLNRHNVLEHDASMSRSDFFFGNNHIFNSTIFATTTAYWTNETLTPAMLANGKIARQLASKATNPTYTFTTSTEPFSLGEMAAPVIVFGDLPSATVNRTFVEWFFGMSLSLPFHPRPGPHYFSFMRAEQRGPRSATRGKGRDAKKRANDRPVREIENERLPVDLGWTPQANVVTLTDISRISAIIANFTSLDTPITPIATVVETKRRDLHFGFSSSKGE